MEIRNSAATVASTVDTPRIFREVRILLVLGNLLDIDTV
jgi:hypothetical protein